MTVQFSFTIKATSDSRKSELKCWIECIHIECLNVIIVREKKKKKKMMRVLRRQKTEKNCGMRKECERECGAKEATNGQ